MNAKEEATKLKRVSMLSHDEILVEMGVNKLQSSIVNNREGMHPFYKSL